MRILLRPPLRKGKALEDYFLGWAWRVLFLLLTGSFGGGGPFGSYMIVSSKTQLLISILYRESFRPYIS